MFSHTFLAQVCYNNSTDAAVCGKKRRRKRILIGVVAVVLLALVLKLLKCSIKTILKFVINAVVGIAVIFLLNLIPGVAIPLTWWTGLISGLFGIPGVIVLLVIFLIV